MKKKNLHSLHLKKSTISSLNVKAITGGTDHVNETKEDACPVNKTVTTCSQFAKCDSELICSAKCEPIHHAEVPVG
ncbi:MAG: hypothetical protein AAF611_06465 [Bacteroidota bacterium]